MIATLVALLALVLAAPPVAQADGGWVLWGRTCDAGRAQCEAPWSRSGTFEAERWCLAARTSHINDAIRRAVRNRLRTVQQYECRPDTAPPPEAKASR